MRLLFVSAALVFGAAATTCHADATTFQFSGSAAAGTAASGSDLMGGDYLIGAAQSFKTNKTFGANFSTFTPPVAGFEAASLSITFSGLPKGTTIVNNPDNQIETGFTRFGANPSGGASEITVSGDTITFTADPGQDLRDISTSNDDGYGWGVLSTAPICMPPPRRSASTSTTSACSRNSRAGEHWSAPSTTPPSSRIRNSLRSGHWSIG